MAYSISWEPDVSIVTFNGDITIKDIEDANQDIHGDFRTFEKSGSIWNFSNCNMSSIKPKDLMYTEAVDLGLSLAIKSFKLALIAGDSHSYSLLESYINNSLEYESPWEYKILASLEEANKWIAS